MEISQSKVWGTGATIMVSFPLRCKDELHSSQRGTRVTKASHDFGNIVKGEDMSVIDLDNRKHLGNPA
jgi:hypothetical protein